MFIFDRRATALDRLPVAQINLFGAVAQLGYRVDTARCEPAEKSADTRQLLWVERDSF